MNAPLVCLLVDALLQSGADARNRRRGDGCTAVHMAVASSWVALEALLRARPELAREHAAPGGGQQQWPRRPLLPSPLVLLAADRGAERALRLLLAAGAGDGPAEEAGGRGPALRAAAAAGFDGCVRVLLDARTDVSADDCEENAVLSCRLEAVPLLLAYGCPPPRNKRGRTHGDVRIGLGGAVILARLQLAKLMAPEALPAAEAQLEQRIAQATGGGGGGCPLARLRALRSPALRWEAAWSEARFRCPGRSVLAAALSL